MVILVKIPGATQDSPESPGIGASQRIFLRFIESSYVTLDPERKEEQRIEKNLINVSFQKLSIKGKDKQIFIYMPFTRRVIN